MFHMDTNKLRQFCAIAELGSMTKASKLLHITHSGLSKSMKLLQEELGLVLLRPSGRGLALTEAGLLIYRRSKEFLAQEEQLFKIEKTTLRSSISIGAVEIFLMVIGGQLKSHPLENKIITLLNLDPGNIEHLIASRQLDFGITYAPYPMERVEIIEIGKYQLGCYCLKGLFEGKKISEIPFVVPAVGLSSNLLQIKERDGWPESIYPRDKRYSVNLLSIAIELTLQGHCAIYIPDFVAQKVNASRKSKESLIHYPLQKNEKETQRVFLLKHKEQPEDEIFKQLCLMIKDAISCK